MIPFKNPAIIFSEVPGFQDRHLDDSALTTVNAIRDALLPLKANIFKLPYPCGQNHIKELQEFFICNKTDFVFNFCEELNGESYFEGCIAGLLDLLKIPYSGNSAEVLFFCRNKLKVNIYLKLIGINIPNGNAINKIDDIKEFSTPKILKPLCEDGSFGLSKKSVVNSYSEAVNAYHELKSVISGSILLEDYIDGREINATILNGKVISFSEIVFTYKDKDHPNILTYESKWETESINYQSSAVKCPAVLSIKLKNELNNLAEKIFFELNMKHYARIDFRVDKHEIPYVIDVNPNPCIAPNSGFMRGMKINSWDYKKIIEVFMKI